ncbi:MAG: hypothetical protein HeimC3_05680 [Candidatus Heimdallarchaeota archaeon LC_3]|nr:MAG: hypothetical protein HeimC3_05680 [Candidatus Heimdallarchaeota archaeon LC_3]
MVLHDIEKILKKIPEIENLATFYNDGTVFQTTFDKNKVNIPKLGKDLAEILSLFRNLQEKDNFKAYWKIVYDAVDVSVIILKLGEQSNLALFFKHEISDKVLQNVQIRGYIDKIQELIDIDLNTLIKKETAKKKDDLKELESQLDKKKIEKEKLVTKISEKDQIIKKKEEIIKEKSVKKEIKLLHKEKTKIDEEIKKIEKKEIPKIKRELKSKDEEIV